MADGYLHNIKFLVVEDNVFMRHIIRRVLGSLEVDEIRDVADGADALKMLKTFTPDIIITDWAMEPVDGIELTKFIRTAEDSFNPFVPIIMLSAHSEISRIYEARDAGINEFVVKPISVNTLFSRIQAVIDKPRAFVRLDNYFGPDRRRRKMPTEGHDRRTTLPRDVGSGEASMSQEQINEAMAPPEGD
ncbi:MAG: response regulator [Alphaproteobacteria bacterium]